MVKNLYEKRQLEFMLTLLNEKRLPKVWERRFGDGTDQRLWFNKISGLKECELFVKKVEYALSQCEIKLLSDKEKEEEFLNYIRKFDRVPQKDEAFFSDNDEMNNWYMHYKLTHNDFETKVHNNLREYQDLDIASIWPDSEKEFRTIVKQLKRIPRHGEAILRIGVDVRVVFDKLETYDPEYTEKLLLHLQTYNPKRLTIEKRRKELLQVVDSLGYVPFLQEARFSDGTDIFTWYTKYKVSFPELEEEVNSLISNAPNRNVNIYLIPNFRKTGGKFYTICTNVGERLDLSGINSFEEAKKMDDSLVKRGGVILKKDEEIGSVGFVKGRSK